MGMLKERFIDEMKLRGLDPDTVKAYGIYVQDLANYHRKSPALLNNDQIRGYLLHLLKERELSESTINVAYCSILFFQKHVLGRKKVADRICRMKRPRKMPVVLDTEEVRRILDLTTNLKHRAVLLTIYSAGLRVSEAVNLKVSDIDSRRMQIFVRCAKGKKDRYALLSMKTLEVLRTYWKLFRPDGWLFSSARDRSVPYSVRSVQMVFSEVVQRAGILKKVSVHTLRHSFATHLLENGTGIHHIQLLLGHQSSKTTEIYLHVQRKDLLSIRSPLDLIAVPEDTSVGQAVRQVGTP